MITANPRAATMRPRQRLTRILIAAQDRRLATGLLNLRSRRTVVGAAAPAGAQQADWDALRALPSDSGVLVYSAQSPVNAGTPDRPVIDARIAVVGADQVVQELDRGPGVEADSLAVAHRPGHTSLFTWRRAGLLRSVEL